MIPYFSYQRFWSVHTSCISHVGIHMTTLRLSGIFLICTIQQPHLNLRLGL